MTAQMSDTVIYVDKPFSLVGCQGSELFDPNQHGLKTRMISTGCWLGYYCTYLVTNGQLYLSAVYAGLESKDAEAVQRGEGPRLFGILPVYNEEAACHVFQVQEKYAFSGEMILGADLDYGSYTAAGMGMGPSVWNYKEVHKLEFKEGVLVLSQDISEMQAQVRAQMKAGGGLWSMLRPPENPEQANKVE